MRVSLFPLSHLSARRVLVLALIGACTGASSASAADPRGSEVSTHISAAAMTDIAPARDGSLWITSTGKGSLFAVQPDGQVAERPITGNGFPATPTQLAGDAAGRLWSTDPTHRALLRSEPNGTTAAFSTGASSAAAPSDIATGADGNLWFTTVGDATLGRVTPTGDITLFPAAHRPVLVTTDRSGTTDDAVWFTTADGHLGHATADGSLTYTYAAPSLTAIAAGADGTLWAATAGSILRRTPSGTVQTFTADIPAGTAINDLATGPGSRYVWFSDAGNRTIGRVTPEGAITTIPTQNVAAPGGRGAPPRALALTTAGQPSYFGTSDDPLIADVVGIVNPIGTPTGAPGEAIDIDTGSATLTGQVNPEDGATSVVFEYGETAAFGRSTPPVPLDAAIVPQAVRSAITGLAPKRTYSFRIVATNPAGRWESARGQFTTQTVTVVPNVLPPPVAAPKAAAAAAAAASARPVATPQVALATKAAKVSTKGIVKVKVSCSPAAPCNTTVTVTTKIGAGKKAKTTVIASKAVNVRAGATAIVGLRVSSAGRKAVRKAGKKGLATLAVLTVGSTRDRARLMLKR